MHPIIMQVIFNMSYSNYLAYEKQGVKSYHGRVL